MKLRTTNIYKRVNQKKIQSSWKTRVTWKCFKLWLMKNIFREHIVNKSSIMTFNKITKNNFRAKLFNVVVQTQYRYSPSQGKISILILRQTVISSYQFSCELNSSRGAPCEISLRLLAYNFINLKSLTKIT